MPRKILEVFLELLQFLVSVSLVDFTPSQRGVDFILGQNPQRVPSLVRATGFEPIGSNPSKSLLLLFIGAGDGTRTHNNQLGRLALYH